MRGRECTVNESRDESTRVRCEGQGSVRQMRQGTSASTSMRGEAEVSTEPGRGNTPVTHCPSATELKATPGLRAPSDRF